MKFFTFFISLFISLNAWALLDLNSPATAFLCEGTKSNQQVVLIEFWPRYGEIYEYKLTDPNGDPVFEIDSSNAQVQYLENFGSDTSILGKSLVVERLALNIPLKNQYVFSHEDGDVIATFIENEYNGDIQGSYKHAKIKECIALTDAIH